MKQRLIIENKKGASHFQRYGQGLLTGVFWVVFGMLLRPLITLLAWLVGGHFLSRAIPAKDDFWALIMIPATYVMIILMIAAALIGWASYNLVRFRYNERRTRQPAPLTPAALAAAFGVEETSVRRWHGARRLVLRHDGNGVPYEERGPGKKKSGFGEFPSDGAAQTRGAGMT